MKIISTFNALHLGDNLVHLHFLRKLAQRYPDIHFKHAAQQQYLQQLMPLVEDMPNMGLCCIEHTGQGAINAWRGAGNHWYTHPQRNDFVAYHLDWFRYLARLMGLESPIHCARDLLFDYPALKAHGKCEPAFDFLIVNSAPNSGQWSGYSAEGFQNLAGWLHYQGKRVVTTAPTGLDEVWCTSTGFPFAPMFPNAERRPLDVTQIGFISQICRCIIGCVTGPMWPCLNVWNADTVQLRVHLLDHERVDYVPERTVHCNSLSLVPELLKERGLL